MRLIFYVQIKSKTWWSFSYFWNLWISEWIIDIDMSLKFHYNLHPLNMIKFRFRHLKGWCSFYLFFNRGWRQIDYKMCHILPWTTAASAPTETTRSIGTCGWSRTVCGYLCLVKLAPIVRWQGGGWWWSRCGSGGIRRHPALSAHSCH